MKHQHNYTWMRLVWIPKVRASSEISAGTNRAAEGQLLGISRNIQTLCFEMASPFAQRSSNWLFELVVWWMVPRRRITPAAGAGVDGR